MPNPIRLRRGSGAPAAASFLVGEPAWDADSSVLYVKNNAGTMARVGATPSRSVQANGNRGAAATDNVTSSDSYDGIVTCTLVGNVAFTLTTPSGPCAYTFILSQDATGGRVATWSTTIKWPSGNAPVLPRAANTFVALRFIYDGAQWFGWPVAMPDAPISPLNTW